MSNLPILDHKNPDEPSVFVPSAMIREARRQKNLPVVDVPVVCVLDPDGDIVRRLQATGQARRFEAWPCYHTDLFTFALGNETIGIVGCAVGAPFAVLVAEELFACGCRLLINLTSAGQIIPAGPPPYFVIINRALRDEGTSYHYAAPTEFAEADPVLVTAAAEALERTAFKPMLVRVGPRMLHSGKPLRPSKLPAPGAFWLSRWRPLPSIPSHKHEELRCSASPT